MTLRICPLILSLALMTILNACSTSMPKPDVELSSQQLAEQAYTRGDYRRAAEYWQHALNDSAAGNIDILRVKTADAWLKSKQPGSAAGLLVQVDRARLGQHDLALFYLVSTDLALQQGDPELADFYLQAADMYLPVDLKTRFSELRILQRSMQSDPFGPGLAEVTELSKSMTEFQPDVALEILRLLETVPSGQLAAMIDSQVYDPQLTAWLELSLLIRTTLISAGSASDAFREWAANHDEHSITESNFTELITRYYHQFPIPARVAILLPAEGGLSAAAKAIRDGIMVAYLEQPGESSIRFYSSGENTESAVAAYRQASVDGATQVIGPLRAESTSALAQLDDIPVPILLLNTAVSEDSEDNGRATLVNSLSLSQADEAVAIAGVALANGQKRAMMIVPDSPWGARIESAFSTAFEEGGGQISAIGRFNRSADQNALLTRLLKIDESRQRKTDLQSRLAIPLAFEPHRRDDFEFIFMAANPAEGREFKPLLRFHDTGDIPVYAMARVFSGKTEKAYDQDLNDVVFPTTPWQLQASVDQPPLPDSIRDGAFGNLYALGQDAWRLLQWLPLMRKDPELQYPGNIGTLSLQTDGSFYRQPAWAIFSAGQPVPYQWPNDHLTIINR